MIRDDIDPSLRTGEPMLESLDDGFSPPLREPQPEPAEAEPGAEPLLGPQSQF
jgi:hypothetical protein